MKMPAALQALVNVLINLFLNALNITGFVGWVGTLALRYGGQQLYEDWLKWAHDHARAKEQSAAKEAANKIIDDPNSTPEQRGKAYEDYFNAGRKP